MADPATLAIVGAGTSAGGSLLSAIGGAQSGAAQSKAYQYRAGVSLLNAQIAQQNAQYALKQGEEQAVKYGIGARQQAGAIRAAQGASGLDVNTGSAKQVQTSQHTVSTMDLDTIRQNAAKTAYNYQVQAWNDMMSAGNEQMAASQASKAADINVASSLIGGAGSVASKWLQGSQYFNSNSE